MNTFVSMMQLGVTSYAGSYSPDTGIWTSAIVKREDGVLIVGAGCGPDPEAAARAALRDLREQIAKAMGPSAEVCR